MVFKITSKSKLITISIIVVLLTVLTFCFITEATDIKDAKQQNLTILMYHSINDTAIGMPELSVKADAFDEQMHYLAENGYTPIFLDELDELSNYNNPIVITFDDGYADNYTYAYPILKKYNMKATVFMVSGYIDSGGFLTKSQIAEMRDLISFQSHTVEHCKLSELSLEQVNEQCILSKEALSSVTKKPVYAISYPYGLYTADVSRIASKYYNCAVTTTYGYNTADSDRYQLNRIAISREDKLQDFISKLS